MGKLALERDSIVKREFGLSKKELKAELASWFDESQQFPAEISCTNPQLFYGLSNRFSQSIRGDAVFSVHQAKSDLLKIMKSEGIPKSEFLPILLATAVLLQGKSAEVVSGHEFNVYLSFDAARQLSISVVTRTTGSDEFLGIATTFLETGISAASIGLTQGDLECQLFLIEARRRWLVLLNGLIDC